ncbi:hypothetical protein AVEN_231241-1 [Araneus ventricosus]|uniref:Uncharacterized protein n=1 Tax=Araneus ventricosus TaxID=182803 RepID=A0A4Y2IIY2_ARAVE|nr:hypothetical protein AVEN_231241-1 [Araneus ventricosus]
MVILNIVTKIALWVYDGNSPTSRIMGNKGLFTNIQKDTKHSLASWSLDDWVATMRIRVLWSVAKQPSPAYALQEELRLVIGEHHHTELSGEARIVVLSRAISHRRTADAPPPQRDARESQIRKRR